MSMARADGSWADVVGEGRLPRFVLICLGVWISAADSMVTATIMPSVGADLGGYGYFSWAVAGFLVGAILAGASAGRLSEMFGLGHASALSGVVCALGCVFSAMAPNVGVFLLGRLVQGVSCGWISGFSMVAIAMLFPERHLARVFASVSGVWGVATVLGPLVGGVFAEAHAWRGVFWLFALQALAFSAAALWLLRGSPRPQGGSGVPWLQLAVLTVGVSAIAVADVIHGAVLALALVAAGLGVLWLVLRIDAHAAVRLLPHRAGDMRTIVGAGYAAMFWMTAASMGFAVYGPAILQQLRGMSPLWAGYAIGVESIAWTIAAIAVASARGWWDAFWVRFGALCLVASLVILTATMGQGALAWVLLGGALLGAAFGFSWSFMTRRIMAVLSDEDRAIGTSATIAIRQTGAAAGAAISGAAANLVGFSSGLTSDTAQAASIWVFAAVIPVAAIGGWAAFRLTGRAQAA